MGNPFDAKIPINWDVVTKREKGSLLPIQYKCQKCQCKLYRLYYSRNYSFHIVGLICPKCNAVIIKEKDLI